MEPRGGVWQMTPVTITAATTAAGTASMAFPDDLTDACFVMNITTFTGTTPKVDWSLQTSPDQGTTWFTTHRGNQVSLATGVVGIHRMVCSFNGSAQNSATGATGANAGNTGIVTLATANSNLTSGCPIIPGYMRFYYVFTATTPALTAKIWGWGNRIGRGLMTP